MTGARVRDERLCWLSLRGRLQQRVHRRRMWETMLTLGLSPDAVRDWERKRLARFAVAVDETAARLTAAERVELRASGEVPGWFLAAVLERYRRVRL